MAYHIFEINAFRQLTFVRSVPHYRDAKRQVRELRGNASSATESTFRMMFAADRDQAQRLLKEKREARPMGEHD